MRLNQLLAVCSFAALLAVSMAHSATFETFDFANIADSTLSSATLDSYTGSVGPGPFSGELGAETMNFSSGGIGLTVTAFVATGPVNPYLDSTWTHSGGGGQGGLGVCQLLTFSNQCDPSSDDNVTFGETLVLTFDQKVTIKGTVFRNGNHNTNFTGDFVLAIDGGAATTVGLVNLLPTDFTGTVFEFSNPNAGGGSNVSNDQQFYINTVSVTPIPVPAAVWLFGSGLIGLAAVARRRA